MSTPFAFNKSSRRPDAQQSLCRIEAFIMRIMRCLFCFPLLFGALVSSQGHPDTVLTAEVDSFIENILTTAGSAGGVSVAVVRPNPDGTWNVETKGYGVARLSDNASVTADTLFPIASNSKLLTVVGTGLLISNESLTPKLSWDTKLASVVPDWDLADPFAMDKSSILDLMSHRTGLPRHDYMYRRDDTVSSMTQRIKFLKPSTEFREAFQYSNIMYTMLSYLPQVASTKVPLARYVKANVFEPLGMSSTTYSFQVANATGRLSYGVSRENLSFAGGLPGTGTPRQMPFWYEAGGEDGNFLSGPAGAISSANDLATWLQTLLLWGNHPVTNQSVIPAAVLQRAAAGVTVLSDGVSGPPSTQSVLSPVVYGGGQEIGTYRGHVIIEHPGDVNGAHSLLSRLPFDNIGVAVLTNDDDTGAIFNNIIKYRLLDEALGLEPYNWTEIILNQLLSTPGDPTEFQSTSSTSDSTIPGGYASLEGTYSNLGYGNWTFCLFDPSQDHQPSDACKDLVANAGTILPGGINSTIPTLVASIDSIWFNYLKLEHVDGNVFSVTRLFSYPTLNDPNQPFWTQVLDSPVYKAEFAFEDGTIGVGFSGGMWGAPVGVPDPQGETLQDRSEIWMERIA
ncbi:beta-lactamase/transpeptidase-like protein [Marasmius fiardii PR-910]|nr:beta-lactamase/transpeptidase-like protein [Marasmius fiardii PR-910]